MNVTIVTVEVVNHPYAAGIVLVLFLFMIGIVASFFTNVWGGVKVLGKAGYYATAPLHMPILWAYKRLTT
tara:strand:- start:5125 stop:5334 length:210 start_codon:yes stop_codon:yes gene_type:complete